MKLKAIGLGGGWADMCASKSATSKNCGQTTRSPYTFPSYARTMSPVHRLSRPLSPLVISEIKFSGRKGCALPHRCYSQASEQSSKTASTEATQRELGDKIKVPESHRIGSSTKRRDPPVLLVGALCFVAIPPLIYYYWQYRDVHMTAKRQAIRQELQTRAMNNG